MGHLSGGECREPDDYVDDDSVDDDYVGDDYVGDDYVDGVAPGNGVVVETSRDAEAAEYAVDGPVIVGPGLPPEDGSCGQFAVQFHLTTATLAGLKRIADARGVGVPELCRQVVGVFVAQQEGQLSALLAAEAEAADYRPSLDQSYRS